MDFDTINLLSGKVFQITWDLGRRCNYDCTYCPVTRHDNFSPHASLDELKNSVNFVYSYVDLYMQYRKEDRASISFTGGEPTVNPNFIPSTNIFLSSKAVVEIPITTTNLDKKANILFPL